MYIVGKTREEQILINRCKAKLLKEEKELKVAHDHILFKYLMSKYLGGVINGERSSGKNTQEDSCPRGQ